MNPTNSKYLSTERLSVPKTVLLHDWRGFVELAGSTANNPEYKPDSLIVYVGSDDIDADLAKVESLGGKTVFPKTEIPHVGWFAIFTDPTGNRIALFKGVGQQG